jgi:serine phosphatase RsbU (regulator of sigma subunit)
MHPILSHSGRLLLYLVAWLPIAGLLAILFAVSGGIPWLQAAALAAPMALIYAFVCLASWYPCQAMQPGKVGLGAMALTHAVAASFSAGIWLLVGVAWASLLGRFETFEGLIEPFPNLHPWILAVGLFLYLLVAAANYLLVAIQASQEAESQNLELRVRAQEAELKAVRAEREQELAERELELARSIQRRLLPPSEIEGTGFRVAARNLPAQYVAGDFYDVFQLPDGSLALVVADVAGKGMGASLIMASVKAMLPLIAAERSVTETLRTLNTKLVDELAQREFVALALVRFDPDRRQVEIANAGLPDPYHLADGAHPLAIEIPGPRLPLGVRPQVPYESVSIPLPVDERLLLLTDGLPEATTEADEPLGYEALAELLDHRATSPVAWIDRLLERLAEVTSPGQQDDITALLLESAS